MYFGADPEFFLFSPAGAPVSAHNAFDTNEATKGMAMVANIPGTRVFRDGYGVELNCAPNTCRGNFQNLMFMVMNKAREMAKGKGFTISARDAIDIDLHELDLAPDDLQQFGCNPAFSAYDGGRAIPIHVEAKTHPIRYAGGHIHFGFLFSQKFDLIRAGTKNPDSGLTYSYNTYHYLDEWHLLGNAWAGDKDNHPLAVKLLDLYCGLPVAYMLGGTNQYERRKVYGQAGEFRSQKYSKPVRAVGIEYRVPGSTVWNTHVLPAFIMGVGRSILSRFEDFARWWDPKIEDDLQQAINEGETKLQEKLLKSLKVDDFFVFDTLKQVKEKAGDYLRTFSYGENVFGGDSHNSWDWLTNKHCISRAAAPAVQMDIPLPRAA